MIEGLVIGSIIAILSISIYAIVSQKRKGVRCIGCPQAGTCSPNDNMPTKILLDEIK